MRGILAFFLAVLLAGCAAIPLPAACGPDQPGPAIWLADRGWHTELLVPTALIDGPLAQATGRFPGAPLIALGFGKRDWITAARPGLGTILAGPLPGPGVVEVTGRPALPDNAIRIPLDAGGMAALLRHLSASLADPAAPPVVTSAYGQHFHTASRAYSLAYTCNSWVAEALGAAGLPVRAAGVRLTRGVLRQVTALPRACLAAPPG